MKKAVIVAIFLVVVSVLAAACGAGGGGGGGSLFGGAAGPKTGQSWDLMFLISGATVCDRGFAGRGAGIDPTFPGGMYPGLKVSFENSQYEADVPEVKILSYFVTAPGVVSPGDTVTVHFLYRADADGANGDYFLARIIDGSRFRTPKEVRREGMTEARLRGVDFTYVAQADGFGLQFIVGLSAPTDKFYLDDLQVTVKGVPLITDLFEGGVYNAPQPLSATVLRYPFLPQFPTGTMGLGNAVVLEGAQSLAVAGGTYFQLYGLSQTDSGVTFLIANYTDPNALDPFFGQTMAQKQGSVFMGDYLGYDSAVLPTCAERGNVLVSLNPTGNSDLSGQWTLRLDASCLEPGVLVGETIADVPPYAYGDPITVYRQLLMFGGVTFSDVYGNVFDQIMGMSTGTAGLFLLGASGPATQAEFIGAYDATTGVYAGQILGTLPAAGGATCTVDQGQFMAVITK